MSYLPSVLATATMMRVVSVVEPGLGEEYQDQLLGILGIDKVVGVVLNRCVVLIINHGKRNCSTLSTANSQRHNNISTCITHLLWTPQYQATKFYLLTLLISFILINCNYLISMH